MSKIVITHCPSKTSKKALKIHQKKTSEKKYFKIFKTHPPPRSIKKYKKIFKQVQKPKKSKITPKPSTKKVHSIFKSMT